jgi:hypothetical protein
MNTTRTRKIVVWLNRPASLHSLLKHELGGHPGRTEPVRLGFPPRRLPPQSRISRSPTPQETERTGKEQLNTIKKSNPPFRPGGLRFTLFSRERRF